MKKISWDELEKINLREKIFILPTDTIYGFSALFDDKKAIDKIYKLKQRERNKPFIHLISRIEDLELFEVELKEHHLKVLRKIWPGPVSLIFKNKKGDRISSRIPDKIELLSLIQKQGPIVSTSLNLSGEENLKNLKNLNFEVDYFIDEGELENEPSVIFELLR